MAASKHREALARSLADPEGFWGEAAREIDWETPYERVLDTSAEPVGRWFRGGRLNTCHNALDRHVAAGRGDQPALVHDSAVTDQQRTFTYAELLSAVARFAGALAAQGVTAGDRVLIYLPMIPEAVIAMLACARLGAIHSVVFGGFAARELAVRIDDAEPKVVVSASCGIEGKKIIAYKPLLDAAVEQAAHPPQRCIIVQRPQLEASLSAPRDLTWEEAENGVEPAPCVPVAATDPLYILYTSGTTGRPKGVVRDNGGHAVALHWSMEAIYGLRAGERFWAASDVGWVVGHSYIVYGPLLKGCTTVLYEGKPVGTPDAGAFWRVIRDHDVRVLFTAPTAFRAIRKEDPHAEQLARYDVSGLRALFLAGERCDPATLEWAQDVLHLPVVDHWWQTETGWPIAANCLGLGALPIKPGSPSIAVPGYDVRVVDDEGTEVDDGAMGNIVIGLPLPPGCSPTLWRDEARYREAYLERFPGFYLSGDAGYRDEDGYLWIMSRIDDVINVAGHRLSTGAMEGALAGHPAVAECAVIGVADSLKGHRPVGLVVKSVETRLDEAALQAELVQRVREEIGPVAAFKEVYVVPRLPKTRSGKILRRTMVAIVEGQRFEVPATIDDPAILQEIAAAVAARGRGGSPAGVPGTSPPPPGA